MGFKTKVSDLTDAERQGIAAIRQYVRDIPSELDTDLNLLRWHRGYAGNMPKLTEQFTQYLQYRKAAGFEKDNYIGTFQDDPDIQRTLLFVSHSKLDHNVSARHQAVVFFERGIAQHDQFPLVMKVGDYMKLCFAYTEYILRLVLRLEASSGQQHSGICVLDMENVTLWRWVNPLAAHVQIWKLRAELFERFYRQLISKVFVVNTSGAVNLLWKGARFLVSEETTRLLSIIPVDQLCSEENLETELVPQILGGSLDNQSGWGDITDCRHKRVHATQAHHYEHNAIWHKHDISAPALERHNIKPQQSYVQSVSVAEQDVIVWQYRVSGAVECRIEHNGHTLYLMTVCTPKVMEDGQALCDKGTFTVQLTNTSHHWNVKLDLAIKIIPKS